MVRLFILAGILVGIAAAWLLGKFVASEIVNKHSRRGVKIAAYVVLIIMGLFLGLVCSIKPSLNTFLETKIDAIKVILNNQFPEKNIMEVSITANGFS